MFLDNVNLIYVSNLPQSTLTKTRANLPKPSKKVEFLAHKTVPERKVDIKYERIISPSPKMKFPKILGKKRESKNNYSPEKIVKSHDCKNYKISFCFNCNWKFPQKMSIIRRNIHINKCYEGKGSLDIMKYNEEQKLKLYRNYPNQKLIKLRICPICGKDLEAENSKTKQNHLSNCSNLSLLK